MARILIVDDSPTETYKLREILEKHGHEVLEATRQLTKGADTAHIPIVIVTTKDQETDRVWGKRQGAKDYLTKPVDEDVLLQTVERMLADG
jgi:twitching motility two-component system response regulator PilH